MKPRTSVYIDGFNLYYGCLRNTPYRWLDLHRLCELLLPQNDVQEIKYFTAKVSARPSNPLQDLRQQVYLRALETLPNLEIIYGHFLISRTRMRLVSPPPGGPHTVEVYKTEEKGSDVNIATELLRDAFQGRFDVAVLITNDSDLLRPIQVVKSDLGLPVGIITPFKRFARVLQHEASFKKRIRKGVLAASQFPPTLTDARGTFSKPASW
ncbi:NYN domain-containing protein [bacterium]|nr:NYN domain-containing protein [bacterium]